ncbi:hypothetical protein ACKI1Z_43360, partial [Streptomyces galilaeus]|uniref:hypothetical protein n=1 Tax=Streptomyces galilaeus TaxID=33899 RepID=UPI0038F6A302
FGSSTPELAEMVDHARSSATAADAAPTLQEISTYLTDQAWFVPVYYGDAIAFARPGFQVALWPGQTVPWIYGFGYQN